MQCADVSCAALAVLVMALQLAALPAGARAVAAASGYDEQPPAAVNYPSCIKLSNARKLRVPPHENCVSVNGKPVNVTLYWGSGPARAATALLHALLRHVLRYRRVRVVRGSHRTVDFAREVPFHPAANYTDLVIALSTAWEPEEPFPWSPREGKSVSLAGPRLYDFGTSSVPARCRLHARLSQAARSSPACLQYTRWTFYTKANVLTLCDFQIALHPIATIIRAHQIVMTKLVDSPGIILLRLDNVSAADVIVVSGCEVASQRLKARAATAPLRVHSSSRAELRAALRAAERSVLFIDYDIWLGAPDIARVESPPCVSVNDANCQQELDTAIAMRVADTQILQTYAPRLFKLVYDFKMTTESLREILDQEANGKHIDEAACRWGFDHQSHFSNLEYFKKNIYNMIIYFCDNSDTETYIKIATKVGQYIGTKRSRLGFATNVSKTVINCLDEYYFSNELANRTNFVASLLGVVSQAVAGASEATSAAGALRIPLLLVDAVPDDAPGSRGTATWRVAGRPRHVAAALQRFVRRSSWSRVAVLSEPTALAEHYYVALQDGAEFILHRYVLPLHLTEERAEEALRELEITNSRIVFVNADADSAAVLLTAALKRRMSYSDGFVWILRDWRPTNATCNITHFTISLWSRGKEDVIGDHDELRTRLGKLLSGRQWPPHAASLTNAMLTLAYGYRAVFLKQQDAFYDLHSNTSIRTFNEGLSETPVDGINQRLHYKERSIEETFVYVDKWRGDTFERLATWRVNATSGDVRGEYQPPDSLPRDDGRRHCTVCTGDPFYPDCHDGATLGVLLLLVFTSLALLLVRRVHRRHYLVERNLPQLDNEDGSVRMTLLGSRRILV